ncbi:DNA-3-methyladenine glycosylase I [Micrococcoides hystricis]|uniref:DNA-3-methyladenine glycosylase I n=1 Tax=Micrococcoides hystricis TaxID=1572761 RepID=A0ABV6PA63_9MICC
METRASNPPDLQPGPDGKLRSAWALADPLLLDYYDQEWGVPVRDEQGLFERLSLEGFQAGLSWLTVLRRRDRLRTAFHNFVPDKVVGMDEDEIEALLADPTMIRNRRKINAVVQNAAATIKLRDNAGLAELIWSYRPEQEFAPRTAAEVPSQSAESIALAKELKKRGFTFVGPTLIFAMMEAIGMVDTHIVGSYRRGISSK